MKAHNELYIQTVPELLDTLFTDILSFSDKGPLNLERGWKKVLQNINGDGEKLAAHSRIVDLKNNLLYIETDHPGWIQLFGLYRQRILRSLKKEFPELSVHGFSFMLKGKEQKKESGLRTITVEQREAYLKSKEI